MATPLPKSPEPTDERRTLETRAWLDSLDAVTEPFDTGGHEFRTAVLAAVTRAAQAFINTAPEQVHETDRSPEK